MNRIAATAAVVLLTAGALPTAFAQAPKRAEGRYFVELAEIMLNSEDFDIAFGEEDHLGPRAGEPATPLIAELPSNHLEAPMVTIGLNRPSGKSAFSMTFQDFDFLNQHIPTDFDREGYVVTSNLLPPGVAFQRQAQPSTALGTSGRDDDYIPNWGTDWAFQQKVDHQMTDFTYERNVYENEKFRLRWNGGLRYGRLKQTFGHAMAFASERGLVSNNTVQTVEKQDFFFVIAQTDTRGLGPKFGLDGRWLLDKNKKWSIEAAADFALIPETTSATYQLNLADQSSELFVVIFTDPGGGSQSISIATVTEQPAVPGVPGVTLGLQPFAATVSQNDFTENLVLATGRVGFRYQANKYFGIGLDLWQMRWLNVLTPATIFTQVNREATFEYVLPSPSPVPGQPNPVPELEDAEPVIHVSRFDGREDVVFDGINLNLSFQF